MNNRNGLSDAAGHKTKWRIIKYQDDQALKKKKPYDIREIDGNLLLNEGIGEMIDLLCGISGTAFSNANAYLGVGDSSTAAAASQTDLQASTNKLYKAMDSTYPSRVNQTVTFRATFGSADANFSWQEMSISNASSGSGKNLNRKVSDQGTKTSGQTWVLELAITFS